MERAPPPLAETFVFVSTILLKKTTSANNVSEIWCFLEIFSTAAFVCKTWNIMFIRFAFSRRMNFEAEDTGMVQVVGTKKILTYHLKEEL